MFKVGDRVQIKDSGTLIREVRNKCGTVINIWPEYYLNGNHRLEIELDDGTKPTIVGGFYKFHSSLVTKLHTIPDWVL